MAIDDEAAALIARIRAGARFIRSGCFPSTHAARREQMQRDATRLTDLARRHPAAVALILERWK